MSNESRIELIKRLFNDNKTHMRNFVENAINALLGNPIAFTKTLEAVAKSPFFIREQMFWTKLAMFLDGIYLSDNDCVKLRAKLAEDGNEQENAERLIILIDRVETKLKIQYFVNVTLSLIEERITLSNYFRICHGIAYTLQEDLLFMTEHIQEDAMPMNIHVHGLMSSGLMYHSSIPALVKYYSFTEAAHLIDKYAITCDYNAHYPNSTI